MALIVENSNSKHGRYHNNETYNYCKEQEH
jgi:hypothetical protein